MLCHIDMEDSQLFRLADKLRRNPAKEVPKLFRSPTLGDIAAGTTRGNLTSPTRLTYLPLLIDFLQELLSSLLSLGPLVRPSAREGKARAEAIAAQLFSGRRRRPPSPPPHGRSMGAPGCPALPYRPPGAQGRQVGAGALSGSWTPSALLHSLAI